MLSYSLLFRTYNSVSPKVIFVLWDQAENTYQLISANKYLSTFYLS